MDKLELHFETVPVEIVKKRATIDAPSDSEEDDALVDDQAVDPVKQDRQMRADSPLPYAIAVSQPWQELCKAIVSETDPTRMLSLVQELNAALDTFFGKTTVGRNGRASA